MRWSPVLVVAFGCHSPGARPDAGTPDIAPDVAPDGPPPPSLLIVDDGAGPIDRWQFPATGTSASGAITLFVRNRGNDPSSLSIALTGDPSITIDAAASTCDDAPVFGAQDLCAVRFVFAPTAVGNAAATFHAEITGAALDFPLSGSGVVPSGALTANVSSLDFGSVGLTGDGTPVLVVTVTNTTSAAIPVIFGTNGGFPIYGGAPYTTFPPGSLDIGLEFRPNIPGPSAGMLEIADPATGATLLTVELHGVASHRVAVYPPWPGVHITSSPSGIDCMSGSPSCTKLFVGPVTFDATTTTGNTFAGWGLITGSGYSSPIASIPCESDTRCALPSDLPEYLYNYGPAIIITEFAQPDWIPVSIQVSGVGEVWVGYDSTNGYLAHCTTSCTTYLSPGPGVVVTARTAEVFSTLTGPGCVGATCRTSSSGPLMFTASFAKHDREQQTLSPGTADDVMAWAPDGDLVIAGGNVIAKLGPDGALRWSRRLPDIPVGAQSHDLIVDPAGTIFYATDAGAAAVRVGVHAMSLDGGVLWSRTVIGRPAASATGATTRILTPTTQGGVALPIIAWNKTPQLVAFHGDGSDAWSVALSAPVVAATRTPTSIALAEVDNTGTATIVRVGFDGTPLGTLATLSAMYPAWLALAADGVGGVAAYTTLQSDPLSVTLTYFHPDGTIGFANTSTYPNPDYTILQAYVAFDSDGNVITLLEPASALPTGHLEQRSPSGALLWSLDEAALFPVGVTLATNGSKGLAVGGRVFDRPSIQVFAMP